MKRSDGMRYGTTYHLHLYSEEVQDIRQNHRQAYMFWLHLQAVTFSGVDAWKRSMGSMSYELGCNKSTLRRWAVILERYGLVRRESGSMSKEEQVWTLLTPPSCQGVQKPAAERARLQGQALRVAELRESLESWTWLLESTALTPPPESLSTDAEWNENRKMMSNQIQELELELEAIS